MHSMNYLGKFISNFRYVYNEINAATLTGAIDVVVVEQPDGTFTCSPFHVRFGKIGVLRSREKVVDIEINGEPVDIHMKLGESGEAFFVEEVPVDELGDELIPPHLACSPIPREGSFHERYLLKDDSLTDNNPWDQRFNDRSIDDGRLPNEGELELSGTPKIVVAGGGSLVRTFKAETVERESGRKLSAASADFKPIERESESSTDSVPSKGLSGLDLNKDDDSPTQLSERVSTSLPGNKRKRRKKSLMKKKNNNNTPRRNSNIDVIDNEAKKDQTDFDPIFQIEDLVLEQEPVTPSSSSVEINKVVNSNIEELAHIKDAPVESDIHFFSDTELTPGCSPHDNRQFTPVQSDTEFEMKRGVSEADECKVGEQSHQQSWRWGELPTSTLDDPTKEEAQRSMLHNMLGFMKKTKHIRHNPAQVQDGIYLSDINVEELEPEVAALYFPTNYKATHPPTETKGKDEDTESGNGPSLPHSPHSVEGAIGGPKSVDSDFEESKKSYSEVSISLCGGLTTTSTPSEEAFLHHIITYDEFSANPALITSPNLVVRIDGKMYNWQSASPLIMAIVAFQKPLPQEVVSSLRTQYTPPGDQRHSRRSYSSWFTWGVRAPPQSETGDGKVEEKLDDQRLMDQTTTETTDAPTSTPATATVTVTSPDYGQDKESEEIPKSDSDVCLENKTFPPVDQGSHSSDSDSDNERKRLKSQSLTIPLSKDGHFSLGSDKFRKTLRLSSEEIASLNLRDGANEIVFSVTTAYQGTSRCKCFLFKWRYDDKIVVSDIDGTITKSDVLGHILPIMGKDWAQSGVAKLFTKIKDNGYKLLYLSARAIGQSRLTRDYLKSIKQEDLSLPEGPMLLNPTSLLNAFHTEVIEKKPEEFKISCLRDIQALFPAHCQPFYAGYGNKINDVWAYQAVGIPIVRIFTINHRGELKHELTQTFQSSYSNMTYIVDQMFPTKQGGGALLDDFSQFVYWREPIPEMDLPAP